MINNLNKETESMNVGRRQATREELNNILTQVNNQYGDTLEKLAKGPDEEESKNDQV